MSGLLEVLEAHECQVPLPVKGRELRAKISDLLFACGEWFRLYERSNVERALQIPRTQMDAVNAKLDVLAAIVADLIEQPKGGEANVIKLA